MSLICAHSFRLPNIADKAKKGGESLELSQHLVDVGRADLPVILKVSDNGTHEGWRQPRGLCGVAEITYLTWTADGLLRHTVYVGLREDKPATDVRQEAAPVH